MYLCGGLLHREKRPNAPADLVIETGVVTATGVKSIYIYNAALTNQDNHLDKIITIFGVLVQAINNRHAGAVISDSTAGDGAAVIKGKFQLSSYQTGQTFRWLAIGKTRQL